MINYPAGATHRSLSRLSRYRSVPLVVDAHRHRRRSSQVHLEVILHYVLHHSPVLVAELLKYSNCLCWRACRRRLSLLHDLSLGRPNPVYLPANVYACTVLPLAASPLISHGNDGDLTSHVCTLIWSGHHLCNKKPGSSIIVANALCDELMQAPCTMLSTILFTLNGCSSKAYAQSYVYR